MVSQKTGDTEREADVPASCRQNAGILAEFLLAGLLVTPFSGGERKLPSPHSALPWRFGRVYRHSCLAVFAKRVLKQVRPPRAGAAVRGSVRELDRCREMDSIAFTV